MRAGRWAGGLAGAFAALALALALGGAAQASEPLFGYLYTTDLLPKGRSEIEQWVTDNDSQAHGYYHGIDLRTEYEYGLTDNLQASVYVNYANIDADKNSVRNLTEGQDIKSSHDPRHGYDNAHLDGFSAEFIWRLMSPYKDPMGLALYVEPEWGAKVYGVELRAIVQKDFMDDRLIFAANGWIEFENEAGTNLGTAGSEEGPDGAKSPATYAEADLGVSYRFRPNWSAGLEFRNHNEWSGISLDHADQDHTAFFLGPNIHWAGQRWFVTLSALYQLGAIGYSPDQKAQIYQGRLYGDEHTTWDGLRLKVGRTF